MTDLTDDQVRALAHRYRFAKDDHERTIAQTALALLTARAEKAEAESRVWDHAAQIGGDAAPKRIWVSAPNEDNEVETWTDPDEGGTEYILATPEALAASPEVAALSAERAALKTDVTTYQAMVMDLTAEGEALRAKLAEVTAERSSLSAMFATQAEETQAAKARVAELEALIRGKTFTVDESVELKAENERLRTPQGAAKVLLTISDVEIKPAAKALQDAFNLKGIGWKRYLSALRSAIAALQETKP